jgi:hypothetical protein
MPLQAVSEHSEVDRQANPSVRLEFDHLVGAAVRLAALAHRHRETVSELELVGPNWIPAEHPGTV